MNYLCFSHLELFDFMFCIFFCLSCFYLVDHFMCMCPCDSTISDIFYILETLQSEPDFKIKSWVREVLVLTTGVCINMNPSQSSWDRKN